MSVSGRKGLIGENGVADYINMWFPFADQGIGAKRIRSKGSKDIGDIDGVPYTCIEVKNHANPPVAMLLDNARWKSENAGRPIWFLAYKREGFSEARAHRWHCMTTVHGFLDGIKPTNGEDLAFTPEEVPELCDEYVDMYASISAVYPGIQTPTSNRWKLKLMFRPYMKSIQDLRDRDMDEFIEMHKGAAYFPEEHQIVPIIITPRLGADRNDPSRWYVYTTLHYQVRMLETIGVVPRDESEYTSTEKDEDE